MFVVAGGVRVMFPESVGVAPGVDTLRICKRLRRAMSVPMM